MKNNLGLIAENDIFDNSLAATEENKKIRKNIFNKLIKGKINRFPYKNIIKNNFDKNFNNIDKGIYVEFSKHCYKDKYNGIYKYLDDENFNIIWDESINNQIEINPFIWDKKYDDNVEYEIEGAYDVFTKNQVLE